MSTEHLAAGWLQPIEFPAWRQRVKLEWRARNLTRARRDALIELLSCHGEEGLYPSDATVAERAGCCDRTVRRARRDAQALGLLSWQHTRKLSGGRWVQGSNRYTVTVPERPVFQADTISDKGKTKRKKEASNRQPAAAPPVPPGFPSLADIAKARQVAFADRWQARKGAGMPAAGVQPGADAHAASL
jgi:Helix-turn-helix domain